MGTHTTLLLDSRPSPHSFTRSICLLCRCKLVPVDCSYRLSAISGWFSHICNTWYLIVFLIARTRDVTPRPSGSLGVSCRRSSCWRQSTERRNSRISHVPQQEPLGELCLVPSGLRGLHLHLPQFRPRIRTYETSRQLNCHITEIFRSPSETVKMLRGRPDVQSLMEVEAEEQMGCVGVSVCAGGGLADEVRRATRVLLSKGSNVEFVEEGFGW